MADPWYQVHASRAVADSLRELQKQASRQGRGEEFLDAVRQIHEELQNRPMVFGEALYRLPALGMSVRTASVRPVVVHFAVVDDRPLVFIRLITLLSQPRK